MRKYSKLIAGVFCALALTFTSVAATNAPAVTSAATTTDSTSLFNAGELGVSLSTGYVVDTGNAFENDYSFNLTAGAFYFPFRYLGVEVNVPFYQTKGVSVSEVQAGLLARLPLSANVSLLKNFAPYGGLGGAYAWDASERWTYIAKGGVDFRLNKNWGIFAEYQYRNIDFTWSNGESRLQGGLKLVF